MAKRFTDTNKWKKPFIRGLDAPYKLLWFYILDDCDHAGIWEVDFEVAQIRIGSKVDEQKAREFFGDRIVPVSKSKWWIPDFISFQYGELNEKNRLHLSVIQILNKYQVDQLAPYKPLPRGQEQGQGNGQGEGQGNGKGQVSPDFETFERWTKDLIDGKDFYFTQKFNNAFPNWGGWPEKFVEIANDHLDLLNRYPKMNPNTQERFRNSVIKHFREYKNKPNGTGAKKGFDLDGAKNSIADYIAKHG